jgi:hypothetical protein
MELFILTMAMILRKRDYASQYGDFFTKGKFHHAEAYSDFRFSKNVQLVGWTELSKLPGSMTWILQTASSVLTLLY